MKPNYEADEETFPSDRRYSVRGYSGVAFYVLGWETEPTEDTEWDGYEERTGNVLAVMVGDDHRFSVEESDLTPLKPGSYCRGCGQIGCGCDVEDVEESEKSADECL